ncbi:MAG TPA: hypothetical protein VFH47_00105, partial [Candidatus Thermoplasmatota archaeon]|nr:hypothetical protein [Candidatus Thermoplasmatota archaeon]
TGFVAVPVGDCGSAHGFIGSRDGLRWSSFTIPGSGQWSNGFDPSLEFTRTSGWMYYAMASENGIHVALTKDEGQTWEPLGGAHGRNDTWLEVGRLHDPPIVAGAFTNVVAGDDERVAVAFLGLELTPGADEDFLTSNAIYRCDERQDELVWHYYLATSFDAGRAWHIQRLTRDPVQVGGVYDSVVGGPGNCRNLLDFNDMDIDSQGRIHIGWADGCVRACAQTGEPGGDGYRTQEARLFRQVGGRTLFAQEGEPQPPAPAPPAPPADDEGQDTPLGAAFPLLAVAAALVAGRLGARRRHG